MSFVPSIDATRSSRKTKVALLAVLLVFTGVVQTLAPRDARAMTSQATDGICMSGFAFNDSTGQCVSLRDKNNAYYPGENVVIRDPYVWSQWDLTVNAGRGPSDPGKTASKLEELIDRSRELHSGSGFSCKTTLPSKTSHSKCMDPRKVELAKNTCREAKRRHAVAREAEARAKEGYDYRLAHDGRVDQYRKYVLEQAETETKELKALEKKLCGAGIPV